MNLKKITILGATGSIGTQALEVIDKLENWEVAGLSCFQSVETLAVRAAEYRPPKLAVADSAAASSLKEKLPAGYQPEILTGSAGYEELAALPEVDVVLNSIVGAAGLKPSLAAARLGKRLALANKESLVIGGRILMPLLRDTGGEIIPVDSEHNAIFQLLEGHQGRREEEVENLILTASGGPFRGYSTADLEKVTREDALDHPNWNMGSKITIDSATLMNKGLEVIEAHWLFGFSYDKIKVVVHPQSIIHSLIEMIDGSLLAELGQPDMKIPIQHALTHPDRQNAVSEKLNLTEIPELTFQEPDTDSFPALKLAYQAGRQGQGYPVVLNAANEVAVSAFLEKKIAFLEISYIIEEMLDRHQPVDLKESDEILALDQKTRRKSRTFIDNI